MKCICSCIWLLFSQLLNAQALVSMITIVPVYPRNQQHISPQKPSSMQHLPLPVGLPLLGRLQQVFLEPIQSVPFGACDVDEYPQQGHYQKGDRNVQYHLQWRQGLTGSVFVFFALLPTEDTIQ